MWTKEQSKEARSLLESFEKAQTHQEHPLYLDFVLPFFAANCQGLMPLMLEQLEADQERIRALETQVKMTNMSGAVNVPQWVQKYSNI